MPHPKSHTEIIALWPEFGADTGVDASLVAVWKHRNSIPPEYWDRVADAAKKRGHAEITLALLQKIYREKRFAGEARVA
jgi:hypothetical protein